MNAQAYDQVHPPLARLCRRRAQPFLRQAHIELSQSLHHRQPSPHRSLGVIFVRPGVAEVHEQAIAEILRDMPLKASNHLGAGLLIGPHYLTQLFRVELAGERGCVYQVTEQYRELAAFRLGGI